MRCSSPSGPTRLMPCARAWATSCAASCSSTISVPAPVEPWAAGSGSSSPSCGVSSGVPSAHSVMELHRCIYSPPGGCCVSALLPGSANLSFLSYPGVGWVVGGWVVGGWVVGGWVVGGSVVGEWRWSEGGSVVGGSVVGRWVGGGCVGGGSVVGGWVVGGSVVLVAVTVVPGLVPLVTELTTAVVGDGLPGRLRAIGIMSTARTSPITTAEAIARFEGRRRAAQDWRA